MNSKWNYTETLAIVDNIKTSLLNKIFSVHNFEMEKLTEKSK
jgi:hypothetical protein